VSLLIAIVALGLLASLSPTTLVVFIMLLATTRAHANAAAFLVGWTISLIVVFVASYLIGGSHTVRSGGGHTVVDLVEVVLGLGLGYVGVRKWRGRHLPRQPQGASHGLAARIDRLNPTAALLLGILEQPWTLTAAAAVVVVHDHKAALIVIIAFAAFTVISTATVAGIYIYFARRPGEAETHLEALRDWLVKGSPALFAAISFLVGVYLVVDGVLSLAGI
jgi:threonine/homoserine/homoserine lactone efflux protein